MQTIRRIDILSSFFTHWLLLRHVVNHCTIFIIRKWEETKALNPRRHRENKHNTERTQTTTPGDQTQNFRATSWKCQIYTSTSAVHRTTQSPQLIFLLLSWVKVIRMQNNNWIIEFLRLVTLVLTLWQQARTIVVDFEQLKIWIVESKTKHCKHREQLLNTDRN